MAKSRWPRTSRLGPSRSPRPHRRRRSRPSPRPHETRRSRRPSKPALPQRHPRPPPPRAAGAARRVGGTGRRADRSRRGHGRRPASARQGLSRISRDRRRPARRSRTTKCRSASSTTAPRPSRSPAASRRKNSSSPGFFASAPVGRLAGAQLPEVRPSRVRVDGPDSAHHCLWYVRSRRSANVARARSSSVCSPAPATSPGPSTGSSRR